MRIALSKALSASTLAFLMTACTGGIEEGSSSSEVPASSQPILSSSSAAPNVSSSSSILSSSLSSEIPASSSQTVSSSQPASSSEPVSSSSVSSGHSLVGNTDPVVIAAGRGEWTAKCGSCHGATGQGGAGYPLAISLSIYSNRQELVTYLYDWMPFFGFNEAAKTQAQAACDLDCASNLADFMIADYPYPPTLACDGDPSLHDNSPIRSLTSDQYIHLVERVFSAANIQIDSIVAKYSDAFADAKVAGFTNSVGYVVDTNNFESLFNMAEEIAPLITARFSNLMSCQANDRTCASNFINQYGFELFSRSPDNDFRNTLLTMYDKSQNLQGIERILVGMLIAPDTVYQYTEANFTARRLLSARETAERLAYFLWDSAPDRALLEKAHSGELANLDVLLSEANRMMADDRIFNGLRKFYKDYLLLDKDFKVMGSDAGGLVPPQGDQCNTTGQCQAIWPNATDCKDSQSATSVCMCGGAPCEMSVVQPSASTPEYSLNFDQALNDVVRLAAHLTLDQPGSFSDLIQSGTAFVDDATAKIYGVSDGQLLNGREYLGGREVQLDPAERAGLLTRIGYLAYGGGPRIGQASPTLRGEHLLTTVLCQTPPAAPGDVPFPDLPEDDTLTWVEIIKLTHLTDNDNDPNTPNPCQSCHTSFDPLGFAFENYTLNGGFITTYPNGKAVDASGQIYGVPDDPKQDLDGKSFTNLLELSDIVAESETAASCFSKKWLTKALARNMSQQSGDLCVVEQIANDFTSSNMTLKDLLISIIRSDAFRYKNPPAAQ